MLAEANRWLASLPRKHWEAAQIAENGPAAPAADAPTNNAAPAAAVPAADGPTDHEVPAGAVNIYGWSSDGSGGSTELPSAEAEVRGDSPLALFDAPTALEVALKNGARIQPGDSGGAIFADGKVAGIMSAGLFEDPDNPTEEEMTSNAAVAVAPRAPRSPRTTPDRVRPARTRRSRPPQGGRDFFVPGPFPLPGKLATGMVSSDLGSWFWSGLSGALGVTSPRSW